MWKFFLIVTISIAMFWGCAKKKEENSNVGVNSGDSSFVGVLANVSVQSKIMQKSGVQSFATKQITHVMAVSPSTSNSSRFISEVSSNGSFKLDVNSGKPYIIVFVSQDGVLVGPDMIVSSIKVGSNDLDTFVTAPLANVNLGDVTADGNSNLASISTSVTDLLTAMDMTTAEANFMGKIDDLALRLANPDVDMNGVIDALENKNFGLDWHVRSDTKISGVDMKMSDVLDKFPVEASLSLSWNLGSAYAVYPSTFDSLDYVGANSGIGLTLQNGGSFTYSGTSVAPTSYSGGAFSSMLQWGPDYNMATSELGGSDAPATFIYTLGSPSKQLKFSNIRTKTKAQLNADGVVLPFIKINTSAGKITGVSYKWMKKSGSSWVAATSREVALIAQDSGAYLALYTQKGAGLQNGLFFTLPNAPAYGAVAIGDLGFRSEGVSDVLNVTPDNICSSAMSYDDKLGLRLFAGAPRPNDGVTPCF